MLCLCPFLVDSLWRRWWTASASFRFLTTRSSPFSTSTWRSAMQRACLWSTSAVSHPLSISHSPPVFSVTSLQTTVHFNWSVWKLSMCSEWWINDACPKDSLMTDPTIFCQWWIVTNFVWLQTNRFHWKLAFVSLLWCLHPQLLNCLFVSSVPFVNCACNLIGCRN